MTVKEIFDSMDYGEAPESAAEAFAWITDNGARFGHFIDGVFTEAGAGFLSRNPANGETLAELTQATADDVDKAVAAARKAQPKWEKLGGHGRARVLYAIARLVQKHSRLFAVLET
uniref:aldehyde dehydrogenase family protein n=1 Tax=uncultured Lentibacter sp. TaxID=1659309 RepID=UPI00260A5ABA